MTASPWLHCPFIGPTRSFEYSDYSDWGANEPNVVHLLIDIGDVSPVRRRSDIDSLFNAHQR